MDAAVAVEPLSWRDPDGFVVRDRGRILRAVTLEKRDQTRALLDSPWMRELMRTGVIPHTVELTQAVPSAADDGRWFWLEHEELTFPCYPHEITALQLYDSGQLTLRLALEAVENGWVLKDASAWNVLFDRGRAVFVDFSSFDRQPASGTWIAYGQFIRHYLLPLLLFRNLGLTPAEIFLTHRDGITPERASALLPGLRRWSPMGLELVSLPNWLAGAGSRRLSAEGGRTARQPGHEALGPRPALRRGLDPQVARSILTRTLRRLQRLLRRLQPDPTRQRSLWVGYELGRDHYSAGDLAAKRDFVRRQLGDSRTVLDLGCNAGEFSVLAAETVEAVVAADSDHAALMRLHARTRADGARITPLQLNIARPTPALGWGNREVRSFLERAADRFDCVLMLGLMHHLLVSERATLPMLVDLLAQLGPKRVIVEWVDPSDPKFKQLAGVNAPLYATLSATLMEECFARQFRLLAKQPLPGAARTMYAWSR
jgi:SAM-dependent methyltransferase